MNNQYSDFYHHDYDGDGMPFSTPVNPTTTIFQLKCSKEAAAAAIALANDAMLNNSTAEKEYVSVKDYTIGEHFCIEIRTNNFIPQLYDAIKAVKGVETLNYAVYDAAHGRMITDHKSMGNAIKRAYKLDVDIEVDDQPDMFPEETELSLPDLNDAD
ncbi:MAG: hypothetical protein K2N28_07030 [Muribaculaceae bacterium]|nr:hypothetical protein [Muribaculaceae bacterium]